MTETGDGDGKKAGGATLPGPVDLEIELCKACGICIELCPENVFDRDKLGYPVLARLDDCTQCLLCELHCPDFALEVKRRPKKRGSRAIPAVQPEQLETVGEPCGHDGEEG
jgi:2-oxoglutarate ferredoxin oxidoreductase subunit delta